MIFNRGLIKPHEGDPLMQIRRRGIIVIMESSSTKTAGISATSAYRKSLPLVFISKIHDYNINRSLISP